MRVLLAGPAGYLGRRLTLRLLGEEGFHLRILVRDARQVTELSERPVDIIAGDPFSEHTLRSAMEDVDVVYYPLRFFSTQRNFGRLHRNFAETFRDVCIDAGVKRIVYLGIGRIAGVLSDDSGDKDVIGEILSAHPERIHTIWMNAGPVVGSGSILFEVIRNLVQKNPVLFMPPWSNARLRFLAMADVLDYLVRAKDIDVTDNVFVNISSERISFKEMLKRSAQIMILKRAFVPLPLMASRLFSLLLALDSPLSLKLSSLFIKAVKSEGATHADVIDDSARIYFPEIHPMGFEEALRRALAAIENDQVVSRWTDSLAGTSYEDSERDLSQAIYRDIKQLRFGDISPHKVFLAVKSIGGEKGWFTFDFLWRLRGFLDKVAGGFGTSVGKRTESDLRIGDMLDVWKVVDLKDGQRLLLEAQMKVFGKAWLEFKIEGSTLMQSAYYYPNGLMGRLYWYSMLPFHFFIFRDMIKNIVRHAREMD
jgi:uncharacterized protein YbjT (DUF2867 family)